jgi:hypothetical protein
MVFKFINSKNREGELLADGCYQAQSNTTEKTIIKFDTDFTITQNALIFSAFCFFAEREGFEPPIQLPV